jgi:hypothetical protein
LGLSTLSSPPRQLFRSSLLKFALEKYIERESERYSLATTPQATAGWISAWKKAVFDELAAAPDASRVDHQIVNPAIKHELFCDWLLASYLTETSPQNLQAALSRMLGPRRRSVMSLMLEVLLLADKTTALTETMFRVDPLMAAAGFVRKNPVNARIQPEYFFKRRLAATLLKEELDESPWLKAAVCALMCGPAAAVTVQAIEDIANRRVPSIPGSIQQTLNESAFWLLLDVQDAVHGHPKCAAELAKHVIR